MANEKSGHVSMTVEGRKYTGYYIIEDGVLRLSTEIGTLQKRFEDGSAKHVAEQLLARLVREEIKG